MILKIYTIFVFVSDFKQITGLSHTLDLNIPRRIN